MKQEDFVELFRNYLVSVKITADTDYHNSFSRWYGENNAFISYPAEPIASIVSVIQKESPQLAEKTIRTLFQAAAQELVEKHLVSEDADPEIPVNVQSLVTEFTSEIVTSKGEELQVRLFEQVIDFVALVPILGLSLGIPTFEIADGTLFRRDTELLRYLDSIGIAEPMREVVEKDYADALVFYVCRAQGDPELAHELAREPAGRAIDLLRFYLTPNQLEAQERHQLIRIAGDPDTTKRSILLHAPEADEDGHTESTLRSEFSKHLRYELDADRLPKMNDAGLARLQQAVLYSGSKSDIIDSRLQRALRWFSYGVAAYELDQKFVGFAVALETALTDQTKQDPTRSWGGITQNLAEGTAFLLASSIEDRKEWATQVRKLYSVRSRAVHGGHPATREDVEKMQDTARRVIISFVQKEFSTWNDFEEWIAAQKYGPEEA